MGSATGPCRNELPGAVTKACAGVFGARWVQPSGRDAVQPCPPQTGRPPTAPGDSAQGVLFPGKPQFPETLFLSNAAVPRHVAVLIQTAQDS